MAHSSSSYPQLSTYPKVRDELVETFASGKTLSLEYRKQQLAQLGYMLQENDKAFEDAIFADLGRSPFETGFAELGLVVEQVLLAIHNLDNWAAPQLVPESELDPFHKGWDAKTVKQPRGVALIIGPWNYPLTLILSPLCGAIAAGCCAVMKPSEVSPSFSDLLFQLAPKYLDQSAYRVLPGLVPEVTALLALKWDTIFYTGNEHVGSIVATAAAKHVTPCTLELGGKCPVIVDQHLSGDELKLAAKRVAYGKHQNAGQLCVTPDYVVVSEENHDAFVEAFQEVLREFFPQGASQSDSYAHIVNETHFKRISNLLGKTAGEIIVLGGKTATPKAPSSKLFMEPMAVINVTRDDALLQEELFGPIVVIVKVKDNSEAIAYVNTFPTPLTTYVFTADDAFKPFVTQRTRSGQIVFNDTFLQMAVLELPFGGLGASGYGSQFGKHTFESFSHTRSSVDIPLSIESMIAFRYPPYSQGGLDFVQSMLHKPIPIPKQKVEHALEGLAEMAKHAEAF